MSSIKTAQDDAHPVLFAYEESQLLFVNLYLKGF